MRRRAVRRDAGRRCRPRRRPAARHPSRARRGRSPRARGGTPPASRRPLEQLAADGDGALPDRGDVARAARGRRRAGAAPSRAAAARRPRRARAAAAGRGRRPRNRRATCASASGAARRASSSRKKSSSPRTAGTPALRPPGIPRSIGQRDGAHSVRQPGRLPAVADDDDVELDALLARQRVERRRQFLPAAALGEHDAADAGLHRSRPEARIATRWPSTVIAATRSARSASHARAVLEARATRPPPARARQLHRHEGAVERQPPREPPQRPQPARPRRGHRAAVGRRRQARLGARHRHQRRLALDHSTSTAPPAPAPARRRARRARSAARPQ